VRAWLLVLAGCGRLSFDPVSSGDAATDAAVPFCASLTTPVAFCSDFDTPQTGVTEWTGMQLMVGQLAADAAAAHSPPAGLHATTGVIDAGGTAAAYYAKTLSTSVTRARLSYDLQLAATGVGDPIISELFFTDVTGFTHEIELVSPMAPANAYIEEGVQPPSMAETFTSYSLPTLPQGEWHRFTLDIDMSAPALSVLEDGTDVLDTALVDSHAGTLELWLGVTYLSGPAAAWDVDLDNVVIETL
jgi:hypothetical protein